MDVHKKQRVKYFFNLFVAAAIDTTPSLRSLYDDIHFQSFDPTVVSRLSCINNERTTPIF